MTQVKTSASHLFPEFFYFLIKTLRKRVEEIHSVLEHVLVIQTIAHKIFFFFQIGEREGILKGNFGNLSFVSGLGPCP